MIVIRRPDMETHTKYENVNIEDHDDSVSNTEVEESLMGDDKKWQDDDYLGRSRKTKRRSNVMCVLNTVRWCFNTVLLLAILGLVVRQQVKEPPTTQLETLGDVTGFVPRCKGPPWSRVYSRLRDQC